MCRARRELFRRLYGGEIHGGVSWGSVLRRGLVGMGMWIGMFGPGHDFSVSARPLGTLAPSYSGMTSLRMSRLHCRNVESQKAAVEACVCGTV
jgi:hypothetical protein